MSDLLTIKEVARKTPSQIIVDRLIELDSRVNRRGFNKAIVKALKNDPDVDADDIAYLKDKLGCVPDAYLINEEQKEVLWFEVEDTSKLKDYKLRQLYHIAFALDYVYWAMEVFSFDIHGNSRNVNIFETGIELCYLNGSKQKRD